MFVVVLSCESVFNSFKFKIQIKLCKGQLKMASGLKRPRQVNDSIVEDDDSPCLKKSRVRVRTKPNVVFSRRGDRGRPRGSWKGSNNDIRKGGNMEVKKERTVSFQEGPERSPQKFKKVRHKMNFIIVLACICCFI